MLYPFHCCVSYQFFQLHVLNALIDSPSPISQVCKIQPTKVSVDGRVCVSRAEGSTASSPWARTYNNALSTVWNFSSTWVKASTKCQTHQTDSLDSLIRVAYQGNPTCNMYVVERRPQPHVLSLNHKEVYRIDKNICVPTLAGDIEC